MRTGVRWLLSLVLAGFLVPCVSASSLEELVRKANQEGRVVVQMSEPFRGSAAEANRRMTAGLKKTFDADVRVTIHRAASYPAAVAQVLSEVKAAGPPSWDLMYQTAVSGVPLQEQGLIERIEWLRLFGWLSGDDLLYDGQALIAQTRFVFPVYNTNLVKGADVPRTWEDVLHPRWRGRIATTAYQDMWAQLAEPRQWGEDRVLRFLRGLAVQEPKLGSIPSQQRMLVSGEIAVAAAYTSSFLALDQAAGAPVAAVPVEPEVVFVDVLFIPKGAPRASAATLLAAWLLHADGQRFLDEFYAGSSMFKPGTAAAAYAAGRKLALPDLDWQMKNTVRLQREYEKIIFKR